MGICCCFWIGFPVVVVILAAWGRGFRVRQSRTTFQQNSSGGHAERQVVATGPDWRADAKIESWR